MKKQTKDTEVHGLVVSCTDIGERDRMLSLLTAEAGLISVFAGGAKQLKNRYMAATQPFCYGKYLLSASGGKYTLKEVDLEETFYELRTGLGEAALASYVCEVISYTGTEQPDDALLRLTLNTLYAISNKLYPLSHIKCAFELRLSCLLGFMPDVEGCAYCAKTDGEFVLHIAKGHLVCGECRGTLAAREAREEGEDNASICLISEGVRHSIRYIVNAPVNRLFSFRLTKEEDHMLLARAAEEYLAWHTDKHYQTLDFYKQVTQ
ncbi:MAG: DNA repair protein RecO [Clostridia bacterium]|nr:DNA repair protein RecO [Clostridia bacterium]